MRPPKLLLYDDSTGKPQDIYLFLGRPPRAAFGNSTGDQQTLEYTQSGGGARWMALVLHDDVKREYAYGLDSPQTDTKFGAFTQALYDDCKGKGLGHRQHKARLEARLSLRDLIVVMPRPLLRAPASPRSR